MKLNDITPHDLRCTVDQKCLTVYEDGEDLVIIGKKLSEKCLSVIKNKIGDDEYAIRIPKKYIYDSDED